MSSIYVFCVRAELGRWLGYLAEKWRLEFLSFQPDRSMPAVFDRQPIAIESETFRIFGLPSDSNRIVTSSSDVRAREWGWLDIRPGGIRALKDGSAVLAISEIHGEDFEEEPVHPARFVKWLKRELRKRGEITYGVEGRNVVTGGTDTYRDLAYTPKALDAFREGTKWKQDPYDRVVFEPIAAP